MLLEVRGKITTKMNEIHENSNALGKRKYKKRKKTERYGFRTVHSLTDEDADILEQVVILTPFALNLIKEFEKAMSEYDKHMIKMFVEKYCDSMCTLNINLSALGSTLKVLEINSIQSIISFFQVCTMVVPDGTCVCRDAHISSVSIPDYCYIITAEIKLAGTKLYAIDVHEELRKIQELDDIDAAIASLQSLSSDTTTTSDSIIMGSSYSDSSRNNSFYFGSTLKSSNYNLLSDNTPTVVPCHYENNKIPSKVLDEMKVYMSSNIATFCRGKFVSAPSTFNSTGKLHLCLDSLNKIRSITILFQ